MIDRPKRREQKWRGQSQRSWQHQHISEPNPSSHYSKSKRSQHQLSRHQKPSKRSVKTSAAGCCCERVPHPPWWVASVQLRLVTRLPSCSLPLVGYLLVSLYLLRNKLNSLQRVTCFVCGGRDYFGGFGGSKIRDRIRLLPIGCLKLMSLVS